ncbi:MAG: sugar transferase [Christensenellaceae bacterium]
MFKVFTPRNFRRAILFVEKLLIIASAILSYMLVVFLYYPNAVFSDRGNYVLAVTYAVILVGLGIAYGCFKVGIIRFKELVFSYMITIFLTNGISYLITSMVAGELINIFPLLLLSVVQILMGILLYYLANKTYFALNPAKETLVICSNSEHDVEVMHKFGKIHERYRIKRILFENEPMALLEEEIDKYQVIIIGNIDIVLRQNLMKYCYEHNKRLFVLPSTQDIVMQSAAVTQIGDSMAFLCKNRVLSVEQLALKRAMDIFVSLIILIIASPIMLMIALIIKLYDGGPVFYKQLRNTRNGEVFWLYKFRSMIVDAEKDGAQYTVDNDARITPVGKFIRATRIDELPQMLNILRGDMSLVGPRAERVENTEAYSELMPEFKYRLKVKAGLTGYAQIYGKYNTSYEDKARMDMYYIENYSFLLDLKLLVYTVKIIFVKESTEGFEYESLKNEENNTSLDD